MNSVWTGILSAGLWTFGKSDPAGKIRYSGGGGPTALSRMKRAG